MAGRVIERRQWLRSGGFHLCFSACCLPGEHLPGRRCVWWWEPPLHGGRVSAGEVAPHWSAALLPSPPALPAQPLPGLTTEAPPGLKQRKVLDLWGQRSLGELCSSSLLSRQRRMKRCPTSPTIREMHRETQRGATSHLVGWGLPQRRGTPNAREGVLKRGCLCTSGENVSCCNPCKIAGAPQKLELPRDPAVPFPGVARRTLV